MAKKYKVSWNTAQTNPEQVEKVLEREGLRVVEKGIQPCGTFTQHGKYIVIEMTGRDIKKLFAKYPVWMLLEDMVVALNVGRGYDGSLLAIQ